jgi:Zn-dependent peptidase ImmA (M78 family)
MVLFDDIERAAEAHVATATSPPIQIDEIATEFGFKCLGTGAEARAACARRIAFRQHPRLHERQADHYAAHLLVPERLLMLALGDLDQESLFAMRDAMYVARALAARFVVPLPMMYGRLDEIGLLQLFEEECRSENRKQRRTANAN